MVSLSPGPTPSLHLHNTTTSISPNYPRPFHKITPSPLPLAVLKKLSLLRTVTEQRSFLERERESENVEGSERGPPPPQRQGLRGATAGAADRRGGAEDVVAVQSRDRRVHGDVAVPVRERGHRHRLQEPGRPLRRRRPPRHRLGLRRHDLRPRLLHRRYLRRSHKPGGDVGVVSGSEGVADTGGGVHGGSVFGSHLRSGTRQGHHEAPLQFSWRRSQLRRRRFQLRHRPRRRDPRHLRACLHRLLRHRPQAERSRLSCPRSCSVADWVRRVHGAFGHNTHYRYRNQSGEELRRCCDLQQPEDLGRPVDFLGRTVRRSSGGGGVSSVRTESRSH